MWAALVLAACGDKGGDDTAALPDGGAGTDGGAADRGAADGGGDGGAGDGGGGDGGAGDGGASAGPCPSYLGLGAVGSLRHYRTTAAYEALSGASGTWTMTTVQADAEPVLDYASTWHDSTGGVSTTTATYRYSCDDSGASLTSYDMRSTYSGSTSFSSKMSATYTDPSRGMVPDLAPGSTWTDTWAYTATGSTSSSGAYTTDGSGSTRYTAGSATSVTVPAGTYSVLPLTMVTTVSGGSSSTIAHMGDGVGMVASDSGELVSVE